jgi:putative heme-binding domain-containing protein
MHALWTLVSYGRLDETFHHELLASADASLRAWAVRAAGNMGNTSGTVRAAIERLSRDPSADVRLQVAVAAKKLNGGDPLTLLLTVLEASFNDPIIPNIVWQNLHPMLDEHGSELVDRLLARPLSSRPSVAPILPRLIDRLLATRHGTSAIPKLLSHILGDSKLDSELAKQCLADVRRRILRNELSGEHFLNLAKSPEAQRVLADRRHPLSDHVFLLVAAVHEVDGQRLDGFVVDSSRSDDSRLDAIAILAKRKGNAVDLIDRVFNSSSGNSETFLAEFLSSLGQLNDDKIASALLDRMPALDEATKPRLVDLMTQRPAWAKQLLSRIADGTLSKDLLHTNQLRKLQATRDAQIVTMIGQIWGTIRTERNRNAEQSIQHIRDLMMKSSGDVHRGAAVFAKHCGQCHKIFGEGASVAPDITDNGRGSFEQLLSNVFDPNLVIGSGYQARTLITTDGRSLTGLLVEESPQRITLRMQGDKQETISRDAIEEMATSPLSLMPEGWEKQLSDQDLVDLMSFLCLDAPPSNPKARPIPGTPERR